jgi:superfamily II DNA or RNA helicase
MDINFKTFGKFGMYESPETLSYIRRVFSVPNPNPKASAYSKTLHAILPNGRFDIGLYFDIRKEIEKKYPDANIVETSEFKEAIYPYFLNTIPVIIDGIDYYDYQAESISIMLSSGRGVIKLPTGSGKSIVVGGFVRTILDENPDLKITCMVPNIGLLNQLYKEFTEVCGINSVTRWSGKHVPDLDASVLICNNQILVVDPKNTHKLIGDRDVIIIDECHKIKKGGKINSVIHDFSSNNIYGLTGTIPKEMIDAWNIIGKIGPIIYSKSSSEIRTSAQSIAPVEVKVLKLIHNKRPKKYKAKKFEAFAPTGQYNNEIDFLYESPWRNQFISDIATKLKGNVLILVDKLDHGRRLKDILGQSTNKTVEWIYGDLPVEDRQDIQDRMEVNDDIACIAMAQIFSTGISIKNLKYIVFVCIGKSFTLVVQSIGRSLRLHENKSKSIIFDISDNTTYSENHLEERLKFYIEEEINYEIRQIKENS